MQARNSYTSDKLSSAQPRVTALVISCREGGSALQSDEINTLPRAWSRFEWTLLCQLVRALGNGSSTQLLHGLLELVFRPLSSQLITFASLRWTEEGCMRGKLRKGCYSQSLRLILTFSNF